MSRRRWNFSVLQLLLVTTWCGLCAGVVTTWQQAAQRPDPEQLLFSPDGTRLAVCYPGEVQVWDLERMSLVARGRPPGDESAKFDFSGAGFHDGDTFVVLRRVSTPQPGSELVLWDLRRNEELRTIPVSPWREQYRVSPAGDLVAFLRPLKGGGTWNSVELMDLRTTEVIALQRVRLGPGPGPMFSSDGRTLAARVESFKLTGLPVDRAWDQSEILAARDESFKLTGGVEHHVLVWNPAMDSVRRLDVSSSARLLAVANQGKQLAILDGSQTMLFQAESEGWRRGPSLDAGAYSALLFRGPDSCEFLGDGRRFMICKPQGGIQVFETASGKPAWQAASSAFGQLDNSRVVKCSPDGRWIATGSRERISLWDATTLAHVADLYRDRSQWAAIAYGLAFLAWGTILWPWAVWRRRVRHQQQSRRTETKP